MPEDGLHREVQTLASTLNDLLERLDASFERERRITANLAHELRTPIAELRSASDVAERWNQDVELEENLRQVAAETSRRMHRIVNGLLHMARIESGEVQVERIPVDLGAIVDESWQEQLHQAETRQIEIECAAEQAILESDPALLRIVISNLINNAVFHADAGTKIESRLFEGEGRVRWRLANEARDLSEADLEHLSEPFWCRDGSRARSEHVGLGLALAERTTTLLGGQLYYRLEDGIFVAELSIGKQCPPTSRR
ncbi:MAG: histidine kinase dimerization/phospho-acceptor domain-containing protein [Planctomycetota bacterium]